MDLIRYLVLLLFPGVQCYLLDKLYRDIFDGYHSATRPVCENNDVTFVTIDFALRQIIDLDEPRQILHSIIWIRLEWDDCRLIWNQSEHEGVELMVLPHNSVWVPDLTLYDNSAENKLFGLDDYNLAVQSTGRIKFNFPSLIRSVCSVDVTHFPFDYQACNLTFGSWAYSGLQLDIFNKSRTVDMTSYILNSEWHAYSIPVTRVVTLFDDVPYTTLTMQLLLQRRPLFYALNLLFPCFLISSVAILGFLLPPASGEKVSLEITVLLSLAVFQLIVLELMPPSGKVSFMGLYFVISMVLVGFSCLATVIVLNVHFKGYDTRPLPNWVRLYIFRPIARVMCVTMETQKARRSSVFLDRRTSSVTENGLGIEHGPTVYKTFSDNICKRRVSQTDSAISPHDIELRGSRDTNIPIATDYNDSHLVTGSLMNMMQKICEKLEQINYHLESESDHLNAGLECRTLALALDRLFMVLYIIFITSSCAALSIHFITHSDVPNTWHGDTI